MNLINQPVKSESKIGEQGIALIFALLALVMLSTIAIALTFSAGTESGVNNNYRQEEIAYFAARAGVEDLRDRIAIVPGLAGQLPVPTDLPGTATPATGYVLYLINQGADPTTVQPWKAGSAYMDDELCHDGYAISGWPSAVPGPGVRCADTPGGSTWYQTATSSIQWNGTSTAVPYKWARLAMKQNNSVMFGDPAVGGTQGYYYVDATKSGTQQVCYDGTTERVPPAGISCAIWANQAIPVYANPVYIITAMAVSGSGARKVVQQEVSTVPSPPFPYGLFSTANGCGSTTFTGNGYTDSWNSANGPYGGANQFNSGGDIGSFGNVELGGNANVQGLVGVTGTTYTTTVGPCSVLQNNGVTGSGNNWADQGMAALPVSITANSFPTPPAPTPAPPTTNVNYTSDTTLPPGTYGNISLSSKMTLTLSPGVYNINSLTANGQSSITVNPAGQVVLNIAGAGGTGFNFAGQSITNPSGVPYDFLVNYAGTDSISLAGQANQYVVINAPNAPVSVGGKGDIFGSLIGNTITYTGNGNWHFDTNSKLKPASQQTFVSLGFREMSY